MARFRMRKRSSASSAWRTTGRLLIDALRFVSLGFRSRVAIGGRESLSLSSSHSTRSVESDPAEVMIRHGSRSSYFPG